MVIYTTFPKLRIPLLLRQLKMIMQKGSSRKKTLKAVHRESGPRLAQTTITETARTARRRKMNRAFLHLLSLLRPMTAMMMGGRLKGV